MIVALAGAALAFRARHRRQVVAQGLARAEQALALDTHAAYSDAARLLEPLTLLDPVNAGAMRAYALSMLAADYGSSGAATAAEALLADSDKQDRPPAWSDLAAAMLAISRGEAGSALPAAARAGDGPWARVTQARVSMLASKPELAREPLEDAVRQRPGFPPALALRGDVLRRTGHAAQAAESYRAALAASPLHARATYGLAKLALSNAVSPDEARAALERLLGDGAGTPAVERARAAYLLASVDAHSGDRVAASATMDRAGVGDAARGWMERAVAAHASATTYRVQDGAPPELRSANDDDPFVPPPRPPPSTAISPTFRLPDQRVPTTKYKITTAPPQRPRATSTSKAAPTKTAAKTAATKKPSSVRTTAKKATASRPRATPTPTPTPRTRR